MSAIDREKLRAQVKGMSLPVGPDFAWVEAHRPFIAAAVALIDAAPALPAGPPYASESGHRLDPRCSALMPTDGKCDCGFAALPAGLPDVEDVYVALNRMLGTTDDDSRHDCGDYGPLLRVREFAAAIIAALEGKAIPRSDLA